MAMIKKPRDTNERGICPGRPRTWAGLDRAGLGALTLGLLLVLVLSSVGCDDDEAALLLEVRARTQITNLTVKVKQYHPDGSVTIYSDTEATAPATDSYLLSVGGDPLRLDVQLPSNGRYAVHLVGTPMSSDNRLIATVCRDVSGVVFVPDVILGSLTPALDTDGDTFPDNLESYCTAIGANNLACDLTCNEEQWLAMEDCNPGIDFVPPLCGDESFPVGADGQWNPFVIDECGDCLDRDCWGGDSECEDNDGDGWPSDQDCDDADPTIYPGAPEVCGNGVDENCELEMPRACPNGDLPCDEDGDGHGAYTEIEGCGDDCDDSDPMIHPGIYEGYGSDPLNPRVYVNCDDGVDNNCNGQIDERCNDDFDGDGVVRSADCNDCNAAVGPGFEEVCSNGVDEDCVDGDLDCAVSDSDGDGEPATPVGFDCDDSDLDVYPGAPERCGDGIEQDCNQDLSCDQIDDLDGDGFGPGDDCQEDIAAINPWATEECLPTTGEGAYDEDCDGIVNEISAELNDTQGCGIDETGSWELVYYDSDEDHCGGCHHECIVGSHYREGTECVGGRCLCFGGEPCDGDVTSYCCEDGCQNISNNCEHCGDCLTQCFDGEVCLPIGPAGLGELHCPDEGPEPSPCIRGEHNACCAGTGCTNTNTDPTNCVSCGNNCTTGTLRGNVCIPGEGGCVCERADGSTEVCNIGDGEWCTELTEPTGETCGCADLNDETNNCGVCGLVCDPNEHCMSGECFCVAAGIDCPGGDSAACCPGVNRCVDLLTDEANCGGCGELFRCAWGEECIDGACRCGAGAGCDRFTQDCCSGTCQNVLTDPAHCGPLGTGTGCSNACESGVTCDSGSCACGAGGDCGPGQTCCDDSYCANLGSDPSNCGDCGTECFIGEECNRGTCECGVDCDDGVDCTDDPCVGGRCEHHTYDADGDGYCRAGCPDSATGESNDCPNGDGDCRDGNASVNPGVTENCATEIDDDCDGDTNDLNALGCTDYYRDEDGDTYGLSDDHRCYCQPQGVYTATRGGDCRDDLATVYPGASERCGTAADDDCDGSVNDLNAIGCTTFFRDNDDDGYGVTGDTRCLCVAADNYRATQGGDCQDGNSSINPGASENCATAGVDDNCNGETDEIGADNCTNYFLDVDGDSYGVTGDVECRCSLRDNYRATRGGDCEDGISSINPGVPENCDTGADDNCNGSTNERDAANCSTFYRDSDADTYGRSGDNQCWCNSTGEYIATRGGDCADRDSSINPGASDVCNGVDDDCNVSTNDGDDECAGLCCGSEPACQNCCSDTQCSDPNPDCFGFSCTCAADSKNCSTGEVCCDGVGCVECCIDDDCIDPNTCGGGGTPYECGNCTAETCASLSAECGSPDDGCGGTLTCGTCSTDEAPDCESNQCTCSSEGSACEPGQLCCAASGCAAECCVNEDCDGNAECNGGTCDCLTDWETCGTDICGCNCCGAGDSCVVVGGGNTDDPCCINDDCSGNCTNHTCN